MERVSRLNTKPLRVLQITDPHLGDNDTETLLRLNTDESLCELLAHVRDCQLNADLIVASGDISNDGTLGSYQRFVTRLNEFLPGIPLAWLPGNHDHPLKMAQIQSPLTKQFDLGAWHFILLNSRIPFEEGGELSTSELNRLRQQLADNANKPCMVFLHHQPVPVGSAWIDQYVVKNAEAFFAILDAHPNAKGVGWGHVHQAFEQDRQGLKLFGSPSTCIQFKPSSQTFSVDHQMPGIRVYDLTEAGAISSWVIRCPLRVNHDYNIDFDSTGY